MDVAREVFKPGIAGPVVFLVGVVAMCVYRWGYAAGVAATLDRNAHAVKVAHRAAAQSDETRALVYTVEGQLLEQLQRTDAKVESAHAKADRIERERWAADGRLEEMIAEVSGRIARLEGDKQDGGA